MATVAIEIVKVPLVDKNVCIMELLVRSRWVISIASAFSAWLGIDLLSSEKTTNENKPESSIYLIKQL